jgi:hypothetical protein
VSCRTRDATVDILVLAKAKDAQMNHPHIYNIFLDLEADVFVLGYFKRYGTFI